MLPPFQICRALLNRFCFANFVEDARGPHRYVCYGGDGSCPAQQGVRAAIWPLGIPMTKSSQVLPAVEIAPMLLVADLIEAWVGCQYSITLGSRDE